VEAANVTDVESAEQLALAAYQSGQWQATQRWLERAKTTPVTEWLGAKLLLRSGKVDAAATLLEKVARDFPLDATGANPVDPTELKDNLYVPGFSYAIWPIQPPARSGQSWARCTWRGANMSRRWMLCCGRAIGWMRLTWRSGF